MFVFGSQDFCIRRLLWTVLQVRPVKSIHTFHPEGVAVIIIIIVIFAPIIATLHNHSTVLCDFEATIVHPACQQ